MATSDIYNVGDNVLLITGMLPMSVADDLKQGKPAPATSFQSATVFFRYTQSSLLMRVQPLVLRLSLIGVRLHILPIM